MKIWEIFSYLNERIVLDIRLKESRADHVIVLESTTTFSGLPKPFNFPNHLLKEVQHIAVPQLKGATAWERETHQNNYAHHLIKSDIADNDIVICSDCDEIPNWETIDSIILKGFNPEVQAYRLSMTHHKYRFNLFDPNVIWEKSGVCSGKIFKQRNFCGIRNWDMAPVIENGGWHLYGIGEKEYLEKAKSTSHYDEPCTIEMIKRIESGSKLLNEERENLMKYPEDKLPKGCNDYPEYYEY